jgi:hypothetical protein
MNLLNTGQSQHPPEPTSCMLFLKKCFVNYADYPLAMEASLSVPLLLSNNAHITNERESVNRSQMERKRKTFT